MKERCCFIKFYFCLFCFGCLVALPLHSFATGKEDAQGVSFDREAKIMEINLEKGFIVLLEEKCYFLSKIENKKKAWITKFTDINGVEISIDHFAPEDKVFASGIKYKSGRIVLSEMQLVESKKKKQQYEQTRKKRAQKPLKKPYSEIKYKDGVWTN